MCVLFSCQSTNESVYCTYGIYSGHEQIDHHDDGLFEGQSANQQLFQDGRVLVVVSRPLFYGLNRLIDVLNGRPDDPLAPPVTLPYAMKSLLC